MKYITSKSLFDGWCIEVVFLYIYISLLAYFSSFEFLGACNPSLYDIRVDVVYGWITILIGSGLLVFISRKQM
jgi:hypothetical protein